MAAASEPFPPGRPHAHNRISKPALVLQTLSRAAFLGAAVFAVLMLIVVYRLWALSTSQLPSGFPLGWIFDFAGTVVSPFRDTESQLTTKDTGYIEFPALVALEVFLVSTLVCVVFGYLLSLFVHIEKAPKPVAVRAPKEPRPSRLRPVATAAASRSATMLRGASAAGIAALQRPDWAGYRLSAGERMRYWAYMARETARWAWARYVYGVRQDWAWLRVQQARYVAGVKRDAAWLRAKWSEATAAAAPRSRRVGAALRHVALKTKLGVAAGLSGVKQTASQAGAAVSSTGAGVGRSLERGSGWYWGSFDAASNRFAGFASRLSSNRGQPEATELPAEATEGDAVEEQAPLSRREFLRKVMPNR